MSYSKFKTKSLSALGTNILKVICGKHSKFRCIFEAVIECKRNRMGENAELLGSVVTAWLQSGRKSVTIPHGRSIVLIISLSE